MQRLVTVVTDLELPVTLDELAYPGVELAQARAAFKALGFEQLTKEFTESGQRPARPAAQRTYRAAATVADLRGGRGRVPQGRASSAWTPRPPPWTPPGATSWA